MLQNLLSLQAINQKQHHLSIDMALLLAIALQQPVTSEQLISYSAV